MGKKVLILLALCFLCISESAYMEVDTILPHPMESVKEWAEEHGMAKERTVAFPNGDQYWMKRVEFTKTANQPISSEFRIPGREGTFKYVAIEEGQRVWKQIPLEGTLPLTAGFIDTTEAHWYISYPTLFTVNDQYATINEIARAIPIKVRAEEDEYVITYSFQQQAGTVGEMWAVESTEVLVPWEDNPYLEPVWSLLDMTTSSKWSWDGMHVKTPSTYEPAGNLVYYRFPDNYIARSLIRTGGSRLAENLGWVMLDQGIKNQTEHGFWATGPRSSWLWKDYKIGSHFYDTRFNTDFARLLLDGYAKYGDERFLESSLNYAVWLMEHANKRGIFMRRGEEIGVLVPDYAHINPHLKTHVSLNHQLCEINYFFDLYRLTKINYYQTYAKNMMNGIKWTKEKWLKSNGDLEYGLLNGKPMGQDYPYLTYNDLWETQKILEEIYGSRDADLDFLMQVKKIWMDKNNVSGYRE
ncbi:hypothetical protein [Ammoniphilus sp. CFH 90114]|uniref:hypothetical protein n=1 Tax=Ammoniphilus sp. CFH 90114 TaxID=2493665 RepID=UPI00100E471A|nr:hypothetical protein [Ammoniphilus sp. CFH 90114]RXT04735.1 hypothetical protein EIZ39_18555 [Ammoniphilus sp. CFH 90114]